MRFFVDEIFRMTAEQCLEEGHMINPRDVVSTVLSHTSL